MAAVTDVPQDPAYITYLLTPKLCDSFFIVGNRKHMKPERIGVVGKMLLAHSEVLRSDMFAQEVEDKKDVTVNDTHPHTFKNLLRYVYGFDNTGHLDFDEADNLLYVAEKWQVLTLKSRLSTRLIQLLTPDNICSLLNNPAVYKALELDSAITRILQYETEQVLGSFSFLNLSVDGLVKIVEQEALGVAEIDVWRAAVRWARHRASSNSRAALRQELETPAKHIRVCTIDNDSFFKEVLMSRVLTDRELSIVCCYKSGEAKPHHLTSFSNKVVCRRRTSQKTSIFTFDYLTKTTYFIKKCEFHVLTKAQAIELLPLKLKAKTSPYRLAPTGLTYEVKCTIQITRITNYSNNTSTEDPEVSEVCFQVEYGTEFMIPFTRGGKNMVLRPNNKYWVVMTFGEHVSMYCGGAGRICDNEHMSVQIISQDSISTQVRKRLQNLSDLSCSMPTKVLHYRALPEV